MDHLIVRSYCKSYHIIFASPSPRHSPATRRCTDAITADQRLPLEAPLPRYSQHRPATRSASNNIINVSKYFSSEVLALPSERKLC